MTAADHPHFNEALLQIVDVTYTTLYSMLQDYPNLVVDGVQICTVWRPEVRTDEVRCLPLYIVLRARCVGTLSC